MNHQLSINSSPFRKVVQLINPRALGSFAQFTLDQAYIQVPNWDPQGSAPGGAPRDNPRLRIGGAETVPRNGSGKWTWETPISIALWLTRLSNIDFPNQPKDFPNQPSECSREWGITCWFQLQMEASQFDSNRDRCEIHAHRPLESPATFFDDS